MKIKTVFRFVYYNIYATLHRIGWKREADVNAAVFATFPPISSVAIIVFEYQKFYGSLFKLSEAAPKLAIGLCTLIAAFLVFYRVFKHDDEMNLKHVHFNEWYCQGWNGRITMIVYMSMPVWAGLSAWFAFKYVLW